MREEGLDSLDPGTRAALDRELEHGERLIWCAVPGPRAGAFPSMLKPLAGGLVFVGFSLIWMGMTWSMTRSAPDGGGPLGRIFPLFGLPFLLYGLVSVTLPWWYPRRRRRRTANVLTDRRAIVVSPSIGGMRVQSFRPGDVARVEKTVRDDGSGDLEFLGVAEPVVTHRFAGASVRFTVRGSTFRPPPPGFQGVANVNEVERRLRAVLLPDR